MRNWLLFVLCAFGIVMTGPAGPAGAQELAVEATEGPPSQVVDLPLDTTAAAVATGHEAVAVAGGDRLVLLPNLGTRGTTDGAIEKRVGPVTTLAHKRVGDKGYFLVLLGDASTLDVYDDRTLERVTQVTLTGTSRGMAAPLDPAAAVAYYTVVGRGGYEGQIARIDLATFTDLGPMDGVVAHDGVADIATSADGHIIYGRKLEVSPTGIRAYRVEPPTPTAKAGRLSVVTSEHDSATKYIPDPFAQHVAFGGQLRNYECNATVATLPGRVAAFLARRPVVLSVEGNAIVGHSYNTFKPVGRLELPTLQPPAPPVQPAARPQRPAPPQPFIDASRTPKQGRDSGVHVLPCEQAGNLVVIAGDRAAVVPIDAMRSPSESLLYAKVDGDLRLVVDRPATLKLNRLDPAAKLELAEAPAGVKLTGDTLTWTPTAADVGSPRIAVRISGGGVERTQTLPVLVTRPVVDLGFAASEVVVSEDGKTVIALGNSRDDPHGGGRRDDEAKTARLAVVDVASLTVTAQREFPALLRAPAMDEHHVYVALQESDALYVLSPKDLSDVKRVFTPARPQTLTPVGGRLLFVGSYDKPPAVFRVPDMEPDPAYPNTPDPFYHGRGGAAPVAAYGGWFYRGVVYDRTMQTPRMLLAVPGLAALPVGGNQQWHDSDARPAATARWGVTQFQGTIRRTSGQSAGQFEGNAHVLLDTLPAVASIARAKDQVVRGGDQQRRERVEVTLRDLVVAKPVVTLPLFDQPQNPYRQEREGKLAAGGQTLAAAVGTRLFLLDVGRVDAGAFPVPVHFKPEQDAFVVEPGKPTVLTPTVAGGKGPLTFALASEAPGIAIDAKTGRVTVTLAAELVERADQMIAGAISQGTHDGRPSTPERALERYRQRVGGLIKSITGREPTGLPATMAVTITVRDAEQQTATQTYTLIAEVPTDGYLARAKEQQENQRRQHEQARQRATTQPSDDVAALRRRVEELEQRNRELEAQVKVLKEVIGRTSDR